MATRRHALFYKEANSQSVVAVMLLLAGLAWALLVGIGHQMGHSLVLGGGGHPVVCGGFAIGHEAALARAPMFLAAWFIMVLAMMLPPALPLTCVLQRLVAAHKNRAFLVGMAVLGFVAVWMTIGVALVAADAAVYAMVGEARGWSLRIAGAMLVLAGLFQFTRLKTISLRACRTPLWFARRFWHGRTPAWEATVIGSAYGVSCVGCCWALMLLCFVTGAAALPAMVVLSVLMAAERLVAWGQRLVRPAGVALVMAGVMVALGMLPSQAAELLVGG